MMKDQRELRPEVLIIEDDDKYAKRLAPHYYERYNCDIARDGEKAAEMIGKQEYDVVLLDFDLGPGKMDGFDFLELYHDRMLSVPVIIVTKYKDMQKIIKAICMGAYGYYVKESDLPELEIAVENALPWKQLRRETA